MAEGEGRVFLRGMTSEQYGLGELRRRQRGAPRVRRAGTVTDDASVAHSGDDPEGSRTWWVLGPGDEPFLSQTIQAHFVELFPGGKNRGHGHQNEALFYILEGATRSTTASGTTGRRTTSSSSTATRCTSISTRARRSARSRSS